jgi:DNA-binding transcriptional ArsR family regulator
LTIPVDITDPTLARAYAHPLRIKILNVLENRTASPSEIAAELGTPLSNTSYHVRQLAALGLVELVSRTARRGAIEHHYTARVRPTITDEGWAQMPAVVKRAIADGNVQRTLGRVVAATQDGAFERADSHHSHTAGRLDAAGWSQLSKEMASMLERVDRIFAASEERLAAESRAEDIDATVVLMQFESPKPKAVGERKPSRRASSEPELQLDETAPGR